MQVKQKTKNRVLAVLLLFSMIVIAISGLQPRHVMGECGYYRLVIGNMKWFYVSCTNNPHNTNLLADVRSYGMMIFNPITVILIFTIDVVKKND